MKDYLISGLDIGSSNIRLAVAQKIKGSQKIEMLGTVSCPSSGIRRGAITDIQGVASSIKSVLEEVERTIGKTISRIYVNIGGSHILTTKNRGVVVISRADGEISQEDVNRVILGAEAISLPKNREIIHVVPQEFIIDEERGIKDPLGMHGIRLEVEALIIHGSASFLKNFNKCLEEAGLKIEDTVISPLSSARAVLSKRQKELGVAMLDIGGGTTGMAVFEEGDLLHTAILPLGSSHITSDIAIGLQIDIDVAERLKVEYGSAMSSEIPKTEKIEFSKVDSGEGEFSRREIAGIIEARLYEIFDMANKELNKIGKASLLPAGAVITGGGSKLPFLVDLAKKVLKLPCQIGFPQESEFGGIIDKINDPSFASTAGLLLWGKDALEREKEGRFSLSGVGFGARVRKIFKTFLP